VLEEVDKRDGDLRESSSRCLGFACFGWEGSEITLSRQKSPRM
jgi:hypothetical protein